MKFFLFILFFCSVLVSCNTGSDSRKEDSKTPQAHSTNKNTTSKNNNEKTPEKNTVSKSGVYRGIITATMEDEGGIDANEQRLKQYPVVARVNGKAIYLDRLITGIYTNNSNLYTSSLKILIQLELIRQRATELKVVVTEEEVNAAVDEQMKKFRENFQKLIKSGQTKIKTLDEYLKLQDTSYAMLLEHTRMVCRRIFESDRTIAYDLMMKDRVYAFQGIFRSRKAAEDALDLKERGRQFSASPECIGGGMVTVTSESLNPRQWKILFSLKNGDVSPPFKSGEFYLLFRVHGKDSGKKISYKDARKDIIVNLLKNPITDQERNYWFNQQMKRAKIDMYR